MKLIVFFLLLSFVSTTLLAETYDILIYGGTSSAITAAVQAKQMGKSVIVVSPDKHLGGLSSGGLGQTDSGNKSVIGGLSREFYHRIYKKYQDPDAWRWERRPEPGQDTLGMVHSNQTMWNFEPHVAEAVFDEWVAEMEIPVVREVLLNREKGVKKEGTRIVSLTTLCGKTFVGKQFVDATYEGDLMAAAGVSYHVGRESNDVYGERHNGNQPHHPQRYHGFDARLHGVTKPVSPYNVPGDPESGLLKFVGDSKIGEVGTGDHYVQAYNFRLCLTDHPENRVPFTKPDNYDPQDFELLARTFESGLGMDIFALFSRMPNRKTDTNNRGPFSTNLIGGNYEYPDGSYEKRAKIIEEHRHYILGWLYFISTDPRVPKNVQERMQSYGFSRDEFKDGGHFPHQIYVREARRMIGEYVMTEHDCFGTRVPPRPVGMGSYTLDSHNVRRYVTPEGYVQNEGDVQVGLGGKSYSIDFGSLLPKREECTNLTVSICVGASHIAFGSIRMEPVFMILGQSAATAAVFAIDNNIAVQDVDYDKLKERLLADGQRLVYEPRNAPVQGIAVRTLSGIVQDDVDAKIVGDWTTSAIRHPFVGAHYLHDGNAGKGEKSVTFTFTALEPGSYEVRLAHTADPNRAKNVPVVVRHRVQVSIMEDRTTTLTIDQTKTPPIDNLFMPVGTIRSDDTTVSVTISNAGTTGHVIVDAVQLLKK